MKVPYTGPLWTYKNGIGEFPDQKRGEQAVIDSWGTSGKGSCVCVSSFSAPRMDKCGAVHGLPVSRLKWAGAGLLHHYVYYLLRSTSTTWVYSYYVLICAPSVICTASG